MDPGRQAELDKVNADYFREAGGGGSGEPEASHLLPSSSNNIPLQPLKRHVKAFFIFLVSDFHRFSSFRRSGARQAQARAGHGNTIPWIYPFYVLLFRNSCRELIVINLKLAMSVAWLR